MNLNVMRLRISLKIITLLLVWHVESNIYMKVAICRSPNDHPSMKEVRKMLEEEAIVHQTLDFI
ncbi:uncharacterized protein DS421_13g427370 [Arachis hypogaea]|nr:uncharacterized protein DS421_13g427370 [Arachis hypogaea]